MERSWRHWRYKHLTYFLVSLVLVGFFSQFPFFHESMHQLSKAGHWGAFIGGILYISSFTAAIGVILLISLTESLPIWQISLLAGIGGVLGDLIIFKFIRSSFHSELHRLYLKMGGRFITKLFKRHKPLSWVAVVAGIIIIASPLPDEVGISMLGLTRLKTWQFALLAFVLDTIGVFALLSISQQIAEIGPF